MRPGCDVCRRGRREPPPGILGKVILVISGQSRMMYQCLEPKPEGAIFSKRSMPQGTDSSPHDTAASIANWLESNIQGHKERLIHVANLLKQIQQGTQAECRSAVNSGTWLSRSHVLSSAQNEMATSLPALA